MKIKKHYRIMSETETNGTLTFKGQYRYPWMPPWWWFDVKNLDGYTFMTQEISARINCQNHARGIRYKNPPSHFLVYLGKF